MCVIDSSRVHFGVPRRLFGCPTDRLMEGTEVVSNIAGAAEADKKRNSGDSRVQCTIDTSRPCTSRPYRTAVSAALSRNIASLTVVGFLSFIADRVCGEAFEASAAAVVTRVVGAVCILTLAAAFWVSTNRTVLCMLIGRPRCAENDLVVIPWASHIAWELRKQTFSNHLCCES